MASRHARGFTLIEMVTVVTLLALISSIAVPGMRGFVAGQRIKSATFDLTTDLLHARSEALKRNRAVTLSPRGGKWTDGWTAMAGTDLLIDHAALPEGLVLDGAPTAITFNAFGRVAAPAGDTAITLRSSGPDVAARRCIRLDLSGRAGAQVGACT